MNETEPNLTLETPLSKRPYSAIWLVVLSSLLLYLSFPPFDFGPLAYVGLTGYFIALSKGKRARSGFGCGYLLGCLYWGSTVYWIGATVSGYIHSPAGWIALVVLTLIKSLWYGLDGLISWHILQRTRGITSAICLAGTWTFMEWCRTQSSVAMPWSLIGYTQYRFLPIVQSADISGVFIVTLLVALVSATLAVHIRERQYIKDRSQYYKLWLPVTSLFMVMFIYGLFTSRIPRRGTTINVAAIQPHDRSIIDIKPPTNIELAQRAKIAMDKYRKLAAQAAKSRPIIILWPESTAPFSAITNESIREQFAKIAQSSGAYQFVGTDYRDEEDRSFNAAALFDPQGKMVKRYDKTWLVPMGEWVPARRFIPFSDFFHFPDDVTPGTSDQILNAGPIRMCGLICYESVFPIVSRKRCVLGANLLVNITNDSWAGESSELQQHIAMVAFRAIENRRWMVSSATTGITGFVSPTGAINSVEPYGERVISANVQLLDGVTPYARFGDWLPILCGVGTAITLFRNRRVTVK